MLKFTKIGSPYALEDIVGFIPEFLDEADPRPAAIQIDTAYGHGGGWRPSSKFTLNEDNSIQYPGDPVLEPWAIAEFRGDLIVVYESGYTAIIKPDRSFEVARLD